MHLKLAQNSFFPIEFKRETESKEWKKKKNVLEVNEWLVLALKQRVETEEGRWMLGTRRKKGDRCNISLEN